MEKRMRMVSLGSLLMLAVLAMGGCALIGRMGGERGEEARVGKLLAERYPYRQEIEGEALQFVPGTRVEGLALPGLGRALPGVRFYKSNLRTSSVDWPDVDVLVAVSGNGGGGIVAVCPSTWYGPVDEEFVGVLKGAKVGTVEEEREVGDDIARMFASVTFPSEVRGEELKDGRFSAEIFWGKTFWRRVEVGFGAGRVVAVELVNPRAVTRARG